MYVCYNKMIRICPCKSVTKRIKIFFLNLVTVLLLNKKNFATRDPLHTSWHQVFRQYPVALWALVAVVWYVVYHRYNKYLSFFGKLTLNHLNPFLPTTFEPFVDIPCIDLGPFYNNDKLSQKETSTEIANASHKYGSFYVSIPNHSTYNTSFRDQLISAVCGLFNINPKLKQSYRVKSDSSRGFTLYGSETGSKQYFNIKGIFLWIL